MNVLHCMLCLLCLVCLKIPINDAFERNIGTALNRTKRAYSFKYSGFTPEEEKNIVDIHRLNRFLLYPLPAASNMLNLVWNDALAKIAKDWGDNCENKFGFPECGNIFSQNRAFYNYTGNYEDAIRQWSSEKSFYNYTTNKCRLPCNRFKLMIWSEAHSIGCSRSMCDPNGRSFLIICNYYPPMPDLNMSPYKKGDKCSQCPQNYTCGREFCESESPLSVPEDKYKECSSSSFQNKIEKILFVFIGLVFIMSL